MKRALEWIVYHIFPRIYWRRWIESREEELRNDIACENYAMEFFMNDEPCFTYEQAQAIIKMMRQHHYFIEIDEIFDKLEE